MSLFWYSWHYTMFNHPIKRSQDVLGSDKPVSGLGIDWTKPSTKIKIFETRQQVSENTSLLQLKITLI